MRNKKCSISVMLTLRQYSVEVIYKKLNQLSQAFDTKKIDSLVVALDSRSVDEFNPNVIYTEIINSQHVKIVKGSSPGKSNAQKTASHHLNYLNGVILNDLECFIGSNNWNKALNNITVNKNSLIVFNVNFKSSRSGSSRYFQMENKLRKIEATYNCLFTSSGQLMYVPICILNEL